jgi:co-chaperonin GroES (HSP10)
LDRYGGVCMEIGMVGETRETHALERNDLSGDGVFQSTRAQACEAEMIRDDPNGPNDRPDSVFWAAVGAKSPDPRLALLLASSQAPSIMRGMAITPLDDRLIVRYASFREGYVCETCDGLGHNDQPCSQCFGLKKVVYSPGQAAKECTFCRFVGAEGMEPKPTGKQGCDVCKGSGLKNSSIAIPDASKQDHSFGDIVSAGAQVYDLRPGDRVIFSKMAGVYMKSGEQDKYGKDINYCLLRRGEVMGLMVKR